MGLERITAIVESVLAGYGDEGISDTLSEADAGEIARSLVLKFRDEEMLAGGMMRPWGPLLQCVWQQTPADLKARAFCLAERIRDLGYVKS